MRIRSSVNLDVVLQDQDAEGMEDQLRSDPDACLLRALILEELGRGQPPVAPERFACDPVALRNAGALQPSMTELWLKREWVVLTPRLVPYLEELLRGWERPLELAAAWAGWLRGCGSPPSPSARLRDLIRETASEFFENAGLTLRGDEPWDWEGVLTRGALRSQLRLVAAPAQWPEFSNFFSGVAAQLNQREQLDNLPLPLCRSRVEERACVNYRRDLAAAAQAEFFAAQELIMGAAA